MSVLALVGAKADLASEAVVSERMAEKFAKKIGATHFQVSAVANTGINQMFRRVSEQLIAQYVSLSCFILHGLSQLLFPLWNIIRNVYDYDSESRLSVNQNVKC